MNRNVLVVAAHADDEVLGCAGALARHVAEGDMVHVVFMADGVTSRPGADMSNIQARMAAAEKAHAILGVSRVNYLKFPDNQMDTPSLLDVVQQLEPIIDEFCPQLIYTHHHGDLNIDHRITHQAVMTACRPVPGLSVREIRCFEVLSSTEWGGPAFESFQPSVFVDISAYLGTKIAALSAYDHEMRAAPHSRSIEHAELLARHRGYSVGLAAAESFMLARAII
ncbi:MAG: PIG-L family deacetylase [Sedimenticola thiotaurini]|uniref:PIG-L family deacetylase n=1 Tax=Sedimenticola thiotaurini TaxID=1543721 RepID=A0A558DAT9_9GAMM|nr:MAG: PIG-L family deacetylase [Sedimenticola thiotaurini]